MKLDDFLGPRACIAKVAPKIASRRLWAAAGTPKTAPRGAKSAPRRPQEAPEEPQEPVSERPWWPPSPGSHFGPHFGASGGSFWSPPAAHFRSTGATGNRAPKRAQMQTMHYVSSHQFVTLPIPRVPSLRSDFTASAPPVRS